MGDARFYAITCKTSTTECPSRSARWSSTPPSRGTQPTWRCGARTLQVKAGAAAGGGAEGGVQAAAAAGGQVHHRHHPGRGTSSTCHCCTTCGTARTTATSRSRWTQRHSTQATPCSWTTAGASRRCTLTGRVRAAGQAQGAQGPGGAQARAREPGAGQAQAQGQEQDPNRRHRSPGRLRCRSWPPCHPHPTQP